MTSVYLYFSDFAYSLNVSIAAWIIDSNWPISTVLIINPYKEFLILAAIRPKPLLSLQNRLLSLFDFRFLLKIHTLGPFVWNL